MGKAIRIRSGLEGFSPEWRFWRWQIGESTGHPWKAVTALKVTGEGLKNKRVEDIQTVENED